MRLRPKGQGKFFFLHPMEFHENFQEINPKLFFSTQVCSKINKLEVNEPKPVKVIFDWIYNIFIMLYMSGF